MSEWQLIETAPKDGRWLLLFGDGVGFGSCKFIGYYGGRHGYDDVHTWRETGFNAYAAEPTHWMPLPESPK